MVKALTHIRVNASAVIIRDDQLLLIEFKGKRGIYYKLPGGGVDRGETVEEAAMREAREEAEADVVLGRLLMVWEYEPKRFKSEHGLRHKIGFVFEGLLMPNSEPKMPKKPDKGQINIVWMPLSELPNIKLIPPICEPLLDAVAGDCTLYYTNL